MGLLRGIARTAVVAGTATSVSNRVSRRQARRFAAADHSPYGSGQQSYPPAPAAHRDTDLSTQLSELTAMRERDVLSEQEFAAAKAKLLGL